ncbi:VIP peptides-like [Morone saxatilis]|uniref:VIP peptides-like n=1 Tax=Morone saxatilis TaxID=34816 RepID=UPI0015E21CB4|nr:VIP peptides-like [Morone saxatilis]
MYVMMYLQLLFLSGLLCASLPPPVFSNRVETDEIDWKKRSSIRDVEDLKVIYDLTRSTRHADGLFTSGYSKLLSQLTAKDYLESLVANQVNGDLIENRFPVKRHSDAIFTDNYSRYRKQMAAKKYLKSMLQGKRSVENLSISPDSDSSQTVDDTMFHDIINQLTLDL